MEMRKRRHGIVLIAWMKEEDDQQLLIFASVSMLRWEVGGLHLIFQALKFRFLIVGGTCRAGGVPTLVRTTK